VQSVLLACVVLPVTALVYGQLGLRRGRAARWRARAARRCAGFADDPYHAAADRRWPEDDIQASAARLVLDGLVTVDRRGCLTLTAAGADPARTTDHPVPDALLDALRRRACSPAPAGVLRHGGGLLATLRRRAASAPLGLVLRHDEGFRAARDAFHTAYRARLRSRLPRPLRQPGCLSVVGVALVIGQMAFAAAGLLDGLPHGRTGWLASVAVAVALLAQFKWMELYARHNETEVPPDPLAEWRARAGPHPALVELTARDPKSAARLETSRRRAHRRRFPGGPSGLRQILSGCGPTRADAD
jgi:hypothetical protein